MKVKKINVKDVDLLEKAYSECREPEKALISFLRDLVELYNANIDAYNELVETVVKLEERAKREFGYRGSHG